MIDEGKLREQQSRGVRAKRVLDDELVKQAFASIETTLLDSFKQSLGDENEIRERAYLMFRLLQNFKDHFARAVTTGDAAGKELLRLKEPSTLKRMITHGRR